MEMAEERGVLGGNEEVLTPDVSALVTVSLV